MSVDNKVPEIRFKGFSGKWLNNPIGEICGATFGGGTPSTSEKNFWQGDTPWIQSSDLKDGSVSSVTAKKHITKAAINKSATKLVSGNSIAIVTRVGVGKLSLMEGEYATSQDFLSLSDLNVDAQYSAYAIWKQLQIGKEQVQGTSIKGITKEELLSKTINHPETEPEQTQIGNYFQKLDSLINQHQQKHDKLSSIKKAMLEKMFPKQGETIPEIRFKWFSGEWEEREFGNNLFSVQTGTDLLATSGNSGCPLIKMGNIQRGYFSFEKVERLSASVEVEKENLANYGDFLFNTRNTLELVGKGATWMGKSNEFAFNNNIARFTLKGINTIFFNYLYNTQQMIKQVQARAMGTTSVAAIYPHNLKSIRYVLPKVEEQTAIGNYFRKLDALINQHQQQITKLNNIKQACLSKMFV